MPDDLGLFRVRHAEVLAGPSAAAHSRVLSRLRGACKHRKRGGFGRFASTRGAAYDTGWIGRCRAELLQNWEHGRRHDKRELGLGADLALDFAREHLPSDFDEVRQAFRRRGAHGRFKDILQRRGVLERWYNYQNAAEEKALREWCAENGIEIEG